MYRRGCEFVASKPPKQNLSQQWVVAHILSGANQAAPRAFESGQFGRS